MSTVKANNHQIGQSGTATNNFTLYQPSTPDGTVRLAVGNSGATTADVLTANSSGNVGIGTSSPGGKLEVYSGASGATAFSNGTNLIIQNNAAVGMSLLSPDANAARIYFGTASNNRNAFIYSDYNSGAQTLIFGVGTSTTAATEKMRLDSSGNLGLGVTPSAWGSGFSAIQIKTGGGWMADGANSYFSANSYWNGTNWIRNLANAAARYQMESGIHSWYTAGTGTAGNAITFTQAMTLDASGLLGIGTTSPAGLLDIQGTQTFSLLMTRFGSSANTALRRANGTQATPTIINNGEVIHQISFQGYDGVSAYQSAARISAIIDGATISASSMPGALLFATTASGSTTVTERARITSGGDFLVKGAGTAGSTDAFQVSGSAPANAARITSGGDLLVGVTSGSYHRFHKASASDFAVQSANTSATTPYGHVITFTAAAPNDATSMFLRCDDTGQSGRIQLRSNGGLANYSANNVNLSDRREKTNFAPAKSYLETICAIPVQTFNYIDQSEDDPGLTLGVVAQDVQAVAPELVSESNWGTEENPKMRLSIYQTDLQYALMKCIQEQQTLITSLTARIAALEGTQP